MGRFRLLLACVLLSFPTGLFGQPQRDFSGVWTLVETRGDSGLSLIGQRGSIVHTAETLTATPLVITSRPSNLDGKARTLRLDGTDVRETGRSASGESFVWVSKAQWISNALLIITSHPRQGETEGGWQSLMTLSLLGDGQLEILLVSPNLWPFGTTNSSRFVYRRE